MRFRVAGVESKTGREIEIDIEADSQKAAFEIAKRTHAVFPKSVSTRGASRWVYKMVQVPPTIEVSDGTSTSGIAAEYLQLVVNEYSEKGWEFYRVDEVGVQVNPGCLGAMLGAAAQQHIYFVVTFRQWVEV